MRFLRSHLGIAAMALCSAVFVFSAAYWTLPPARAQFDAVGQFLTAWEQVYGAAGKHVTDSSGNKANASAVATLPAATGKTTYISHFRCSGTGSTAATVVSVTVAGIRTSAVFPFLSVAGATVLNTPLDYTFNPPQPATATNTAITVTMPALGAGNTNAACTAEGFQM